MWRAQAAPTPHLVEDLLNPNKRGLCRHHHPHALRRPPALPPPPLNHLGRTLLPLLRLLVLVLVAITISLWVVVVVETGAVVGIVVVVAAGTETATRAEDRGGQPTEDGGGVFLFLVTSLLAFTWRSRRCRC